jgi:hypothetical protein
MKLIKQEESKRVLPMAWTCSKKLQFLGCRNGLGNLKKKDVQIGSISGSSTEMEAIRGFEAALTTPRNV